MSQYYSIDTASQNGTTSTESNTVGSEEGREKSSGAGVTQAFTDTLNESEFGTFLRGLGVLDDPGTEEVATEEETPPDESFDWRVRLSLPRSFNGPDGTVNEIFAPLVVTRGLIWPYTPSVVISSSANYNAIKPIHSNYPFYAYQNSSTDQIAISGDFTVEKEYEATYYIAALHYLRAVTKMSYGTATENAGAPPPVVRLFGYGRHVFNDVPVVVTSFSTEMPMDVDYITGTVAGTKSKVPVRSTITVQVQPLYSRKTVESFNLNDFINGKYMKGRGKFI